MKLFGRCAAFWLFLTIFSAFFSHGVPPLSRRSSTVATAVTRWKQVERLFAGTNTASLACVIEALVLSLIVSTLQSSRKKVRTEATGIRDSVELINIGTGTAYLCMKTVERAHKPASLWHRVALDCNYAKALKQVDGLLTHWYVPIRVKTSTFFSRLPDS